jgi:microcin C transport system substrate-binding protein
MKSAFFLRWAASRGIPRRFAFFSCYLIVSLATIGVAPDSASAAHGVAQFGEPKYPRDFRHFEYVNPDAPKGGTLTLSTVSPNSSFDKFNPFSLKGRPAPGLIELMFDTLTVYSFDEINTQYGLLADDIEVAPDFGSVKFHINPAARFSNGDPVTADDVKYSFDTLTGKQASPRFNAYFSEIEKVVVLDDRTVRFDFKRKGRDLSFIAGSLPVFSSRWGEKAGGDKIPFDKLRLEAPIASGPYLIEKAVVGRGVTYRRNPDYWGTDIPVRRGTFNFDRIVYKLYKDTDTQVSALRAGDYDFISETKMRYWCCQYIGHRFDSGELIKEVLVHHNPPALNSYVFNLRKEKFKDPRVRLALNYAYDFEQVNDKIFDGEFERVTSYFSYTPLAASGLPSAEELKLLEPYRTQLDPAVFGPMFVQPSTRPPNTLRQNLKKALELFAEAGWHYRDGLLRNEKGEPFVLEITGARGQNVMLDSYYLNLTKLGITVRKTLADPVADRVRMNQFDYDFTTFALKNGRMPGPELWRAFNSAAADIPGSENIPGLKSPVVDELIKKLLDADSQEEQETVAHALDRVLIHGHYVLPFRYLTHHYIIYNKRLQRPAVLPKYYDATEWASTTWWDSGIVANDKSGITASVR